MIRNKPIFVVLCILCIIFIASCKSAPETDTSTSGTSQGAATGQMSQRNSALLADVEKARQAAVDAGAEKDNPDELARLDSVFDELKKEAEQDPDSDAVFDKGTGLILDYQNLEKISKALSSGGIQADRNAALQAKARADGIKAAVTEKDAYAQAVAALASGDDQLKSGDTETARSNYQSARESFDAIFERVSKKRAEAAEAMRLAVLRTKEAENFALEADAIESSADDEDEEE